MKLSPADVRFAPASMVDPAARVFFLGDRVFRAVYAQDAAASWRAMLDEPWIDAAFGAGLVKTWVATDVQLVDALLVLEHERVPFITVPAECTARMHHASATALVEVARVLSRHGRILKDAHPWNVAFHRGRAVFLDFGSIGEGASVASAWVREFRRYYGAPVWLASVGRRGLALDYRREHGRGFGLRAMDSLVVRRTALSGIAKLETGRRSASAALDVLAEWVAARPPRGADREAWASYEQAGESLDPQRAASPKQAFVREALLRSRPGTVLDCAANKGYYSEMAARLGASVAAFDYEEFCVDECVARARRSNLDVTPVLMDFRMPTPPSGWALAYGSAYERFRSDVVLALGLCHHVCITQGVPVRLFCEICSAYARDGVVLEFVDARDVHVAAWGRPVPADYSLEGFIRHFSTKFPRYTTEAINENGLCRTMVHFHR